MIIAIDFDGTITTKRDDEHYLELQTKCKKAIMYLFFQGHQLILNTCRQGNQLEVAKAFLYQNGIIDFFIEINNNTKDTLDKYEDDCRKISADMYIDDRNFGGFPGWEAIIKYFEEVI